MRKKVDLGKKIVKETRITRKKTNTYTHSFYVEQNQELTENQMEEDNENQESEENDNNLKEQDENNTDNNTVEDENEQNNNEGSNKDVENSNNQNTKKNSEKKQEQNPKDIKKKAEQGKKAAKGQKKAGLLKNPLFWKILLITLVIIFAILLIVVLICIIASALGIELDGRTISFGGYHDARCNEITVIFEERDDTGKWNVTGTGTYSMEDYLAGVVYAEVGGAWNMEVYKTFAVAARTFVLDEAADDCSISGTAKKQAFKDVTDRPNEAVNMIYQAVQETAGEVLYQDNQLYQIQYDAFCYIDKDSNYYTLSQQNQKIPTDWVEENVNAYVYKNCPCDANDQSMTNCWKNGKWQDGGHGRGMSQVGSKYLITELGYTYKEVLEYYYGNEGLSLTTPTIETSSSSSSSSSNPIVSVAGLEIKNTSNATKLNKPLNEVLASSGSSVDQMNSFIRNSVVEKGAGTREGVVTAAVSMINYLYDNFNIKLPYYWGGRYQQIGISPSFGEYRPSTVSRGGTIYNYKSFDCSGFVSWAIKNGGYNFDAVTTNGFDSKFSKNSCNITESSCIGQPGDLINSAAGHVELIIAVDKDSGKYFIAHSGTDGVVMTQRDMHKKNYGSTVTKILYMEEFYNNQQNVNPNY